ncbi:TraC family protein, partial [Vibrio mediterranei]
MSLANLLNAAKQSRDTPSLSDELPYHLFDDASHLFINTTSIGMGLRFAPLAGVGDSEVESLNKIFCALPEGKKWRYQIELSMDHR